MEFQEANGHGQPHDREDEDDMRAPFDIFEWYPKFQSCLTYFLDHGQHNHHLQALAAFINVQLPFQRSINPLPSSAAAALPAQHHQHNSTHHQQHNPFAPPNAISNPHAAPYNLPNPNSPPSPSPLITIIPYLRRLIVTGFDNEGVLHGFFGNDWRAGIGQFHEVERRNYLFASKSDNWLRVKQSYDMDHGQTVPFLKPLQNVREKEIVSAEATWSEWLAMGDWMLGDRAPDGVGRNRNRGKGRGRGSAGGTERRRTGGGIGGIGGEERRLSPPMVDGDGGGAGIGPSRSADHILTQRELPDQEQRPRSQPHVPMQQPDGIVEVKMETEESTSM